MRRRLRLLLPVILLVAAAGAIGAESATAACLPLQLLCQGQSPPPPTASPTPTSSTASPQSYGFNDNGLFNPQVPRSVFLAKLQQAGARVLRSGISWQLYEPRYQQYNDDRWATYDQNYRDLLSRGIREIITLIGTPYWALTAAGRGAQSPDGEFRCDGSSAPCVAPPDITNPTVRAEWQLFVRDVVARYPDAAAIEVWNEPNIRAFWLQPQDPALYADLLSATTQAVRQVSATMPVLTGSTASYVGPSDQWHTSADTFLRAIYQDAGAGSFDAIGWHFYPCNNGLSVAQQGSWVLSALRKVRDSFGDTQKPLWMTETGVTSSGGAQANCGGGQYTEQQQAQVLGATLDWVKAQNAQFGDLPLALVHTLIDPEPRQLLYVANPNGQAEYGIVAYRYDLMTGQSTFLDKPAYNAVRCRFTGSC